LNKPFFDEPEEEITRVLLADDHELVRSGIARLVNDLPGMRVIAEAGDGLAALRLIAIHKPHIALLDITMPKQDGLATVAAVARDYPEVRCIMLSMHNSSEMVAQALRSGARGYLLKESATVEIGLAIRAVMHDQIYLSPPVSHHVVDAYVGRTGSSLDPLNVLTQRQRQVFDLLVKGKTNQAIANELGVSGKTIEAHRAQIMARLNVNDLHGLLRIAHRCGIEI
jgi:DNA-binding NarL/FixJ family response regulator